MSPNGMRSAASGDRCEQPWDRSRPHDGLIALLLGVVRDLVVHRRRGSALDGFELKCSDAVELRFLEPGEKVGDVLLRLPGEADDERRPHGEVGDLFAPGPDALEYLRVVGRSAHCAEHVGARVLERDVEVGKDQTLGHQRDDVVHVRVGVDVVQSDPGAELAQLAREIGHMGPDFLALP